MDKISTKILIVEDEPSVSEMLEKYFLKKCYVVAKIADGKSAYNKLKKDIYDVCILDLNIPAKSGTEILNDLNKVDITTDIIVLTGNSDSSKIIEVMKLGASNYIQKPFELEELGIAVEHGIQNHRMRQENNRYKNFLEQQIKEKIFEIKKAYFDIVKAFVNSIDKRNPYTGSHNSRISEIA